jgi:hypothetical protein
VETKVLLFPGNSDCGLQLKSLCCRSLGFPRPYVNIIWVQHRLGITVTSAQYFNMMRNELQPAFCTKWKGRLTLCVCVCARARGFLFSFPWQCMLSYCYPYSDHPWNTEFEIFGHPAHISPGLFWFSSLRTTKGDSMRLTVCSWWCDALHDWYFTQPNYICSNDFERLIDQWAVCWEAGKLCWEVICF